MAHMVAPPCQDSAVSELSLDNSVQRKHPCEVYPMSSRLKKRLYILRLLVSFCSACMSTLEELVK